MSPKTQREFLKTLGELGPARLVIDPTLFVVDDEGKIVEKKTIRVKPDAIEVSEIELRAIALLRKHGPMTCATLGSLLWPEIRRGNCSCPMARPAGSLLHRLRKRGLVERRPEEHHIMWRAK